MKRIVEAEYESSAKKFSTALNGFFRKYPELEYWREEFEFMHDNGMDFEGDQRLANGEYNEHWRYALHLDENDGGFFMCVIERGIE